MYNHSFCLLEKKVSKEWSKRAWMFNYVEDFFHQYVTLHFHVQTISHYNRVKHKNVRVDPSEDNPFLLFKMVISKNILSIETFNLILWLYCSILTRYLYQKSLQERRPLFMWKDVIYQLNIVQLSLFWNPTPSAGLHSDTVSQWGFVSCSHGASPWLTFTCIYFTSFSLFGTKDYQTQSNAVSEQEACF